MAIRGLKAALNSSGQYRLRKPEMAVDHLIIGAGVVGLTVAHRLAQKFPEKSTYLVERNSRVGEETSARNSEVIHGGLYYPAESLKTRLCLRGRQLMYEHCDKHGVPYHKTGKLIVARQSQEGYLHKLHAHAQALSWPPFSNPKMASLPVAPTRFISGDEARSLEPDLSPEITAAVESPETGIIDSHSFFESFEKLIEESDGAATLTLGTKVVRVDPYVPGPGERVDGSAIGWVVQTVTGLSATLVLNALLPPERRLEMFFSRGSYASYRGAGATQVKRLIYPVPEQTSSHGHASLGTHLTLDMEGNIRFGPDAEWLQPPDSEGLDGQQMHDFWQKHLSPNDQHLDEMFEAITTYLPGIHREGLASDYVGIRPKLVGPGYGFQDFVVRRDWSTDFYQPESRGGSGLMISLLGIESPGLTSSLGIAEMAVEELM